MFLHMKRVGRRGGCVAPGFSRHRGVAGAGGRTDRRRARPEERARAQGANEFAVFCTMALSSFTSGLIVTNGGWEMVNLAALPLIGVVLVAIAWLWLTQRAARPAGA